MPRSENLTGALLMMASMASFTFNDALMKHIAGEVPLFQAIFLRGMYTIVLVGLLAWWMGAFRVWPSRRDTWLIALRMAAEAAAAYFFLTALFNMPLANVTAILQALPLTITLAAAILFNESVGWRRAAAIAVGFVGVMLIVRPGTEDFTVYSLYALIAVGCVTVRDLTTRRLSPETPSMLVTFSTALTVTALFGLLTLGEDWQPMSAQSQWVILGAGVMVIGGYVFSIMVMRVGDVSFTAPFRYTALLWALLLGWVVFGDWPKPVTLIGAAIVVASGLFMIYREAHLGLSRRRALRQGPAQP